jgi:hypothetical protein
MGFLCQWGKTLQMQTLVYGNSIQCTVGIFTVSVLGPVVNAEVSSKYSACIAFMCYA